MVPRESLRGDRTIGPRARAQGPYLDPFSGVTKHAFPRYFFLECVHYPGVTYFDTELKFRNTEHFADGVNKYIGKK